MYINERVLDLNNLIYDLKELLKGISQRFQKYVVSNDEKSVGLLAERYSCDKKFLEKLNVIKNLTDDLADNLECLDSFGYEFNKFLSIQI